MRRFTKGRRRSSLFAGIRDRKDLRTSPHHTMTGPSFAGLKTPLRRRTSGPSAVSARPPGPRRRTSQKWILVSAVGASALAVVLVLGSMNLLGTDFAQAAFGNQTAPTPTPAPAQTAPPTAEPTPDPTPEPTPDPTLLEGMQSERVTQLQERLMALGYLDIDETTDYYGPATAYAVTMFQRQHGLIMDGVAGPKTLEIIYSDGARPYTLLEGTSGNDVDMLQERLMELGYLGKATGYYGTETVEAVKAFQSRNGIGVDGKTGQVTLNLIYSSAAEPSEEMSQQAARQGTIGNFLASARAQLGKPYVWGAAGPSSFDCSGLVTYCLRQAGSSTGRLNAQGFSQNGNWQKIGSMNALEPGDLIFFHTRKGVNVGHVGIYVGDGMMIDASSANGKIVERSCMTSYWQSRFVCARRPW